jgi:AcrR family transcriptional regulator
MAPDAAAHEDATANDARPAASAADPVMADRDPSGEVSSNTRDRILDVALDLFIAQGFDGTSLRQIAARLGVTKAALYYHFSSKDDILMALHMRLHEFGREALVAMGDRPMDIETWGVLLDALVDQMLAQRNIFLLHQRNQAAMEKLHSKDHMDKHDDIQARLLTLMADPRVPLRDRVRMAASIGVVLSGLLLSGDGFSSSTNQELGDLLRDAVRNVLRG